MTEFGDRNADMKREIEEQRPGQSWTPRIKTFRLQKSLGGERRKVSKGGEPSEVTPNKLGTAVEFFNNNHIRRKEAGKGKRMNLCDTFTLRMYFLTGQLSPTSHSSSAPIPNDRPLTS
jgi:hypothetical protein